MVLSPVAPAALEAPLAMHAEGPAPRAPRRRQRVHIPVQSHLMGVNFVGPEPAARRIQGIGAPRVDDHFKIGMEIDDMLAPKEPESGKCRKLFDHVDDHFRGMACVDDLFAPREPSLQHLARCAGPVVQNFNGMVLEAKAHSEPSVRSRAQYVPDHFEGVSLNPVKGGDPKRLRAPGERELPSEHFSVQMHRVLGGGVTDGMSYRGVGVRGRLPQEDCSQMAAALGKSFSLPHLSPQAANAPSPLTSWSQGGSTAEMRRSNSSQQLQTAGVAALRASFAPGPQAHLQTEPARMHPVPGWSRGLRAVQTT
eukprot:gnl/TRDRNA2_/TRDRNA2_44029_c0_seq1.p1 gnl/TRDRNA2_/TRDRNA2_44029_c0~~gnl/TRDRNA2_/TRDRNA2_44029_c0_seq1.p1  ORF type:complete len:309 (+),score=47.41 gnl/TRDRNA2_/TRDRNA2_44029_c0_seq1:113-1039(+)